MRNYQIIRATDGFAAVGNSLVVGTAFIWVPLVILYVGWMLLSKTLEIGEHSPKAVAVHQAKVQQERQAEYDRKSYVQRDASGKPIWTSTENHSVPAADVLPVANLHKPKLTWAVGNYILTDTKCDTYRQRSTILKWDSYQFKRGGWEAEGCYAIRNGVIGLGVGTDRVVFFDVNDVVEVDKTAAVAAKVVAAKSKPKAVATPGDFEWAQRRYDKAVAVYNETCPYGCSGVPLKQWQAARDNLARAKLAQGQ